MEACSPEVSKQGKTLENNAGWYNGGSGIAEIPNSWIFCGMQSIADDYWQS